MMQYLLYTLHDAVGWGWPILDKGYSWTGWAILDEKDFHPLLQRIRHKMDLKVVGRLLLHAPNITRVFGKGFSCAKGMLNTPVQELPCILKINLVNPIGKTFFQFLVVT